jgi:hypothetical protein
MVFIVCVSNIVKGLNKVDLLTSNLFKKENLGIRRNYSTDSSSPSESNELKGQNKLEYLSYYLAGLLEGDGHFNTPKMLKTPSGTARVASIETVFALKDRPSAELLQSLFGGRVYSHSKKNIVR